MIRWMYGVRLRLELSCVVLRQRLGIENIANVVQQNRLRQYGQYIS